METSGFDRRTIATQWRDCVRISREEVFGAADEKCTPRHLLDDAAVMFAGYVGVDWRPADGLLLLAINPGGGGDAYEHRTPEDREFIPVLRRFKEARGSEVLESFERVNLAFVRIVKGWSIWNILDATLHAAGVELKEVAYMNIVPYRTRNNTEPPVAARERGWKQIVEPSLHHLAPRAIVAIGKRAGRVVDRWYTGGQAVYCVPRTNGDRYVSVDAESELERMRSELRSTH